EECFRVRGASLRTGRNGDRRSPARGRLARGHQGHCLRVWRPFAERFDAPGGRWRRYRERVAPIAAPPLAFGRRLGAHDVAGLAAELAYRFFLALFPFVIFLAALGAFVARAAGVADPS